ncbi:MAG: hypothetical protein HY401_07330 [Elusimicrobia bacterium]|nr:hypothetical protein [Elusimicrobiota bacterium]
MKKQLILLIILPLITSCSKTSSTETLQNQKTKFFKSDKYPLIIKLIEGIDMQVDMHTISNVPRGLDLFELDFLKIEVNLDNEFPPSGESGLYSTLWIAQMGFKKNDFETFLNRQAKFDVRKDDVYAGNLPAIQISKDGEGSYLLLIPGLYAHLGFLGCKKGDPECERLNDLRRQTLDNVQWLKPIDTNSQEFKAWKAHILSLIEEAQKNQKEKTGIK